MGEMRNAHKTFVGKPEWKRRDVNIRKVNFLGSCGLDAFGSG
jgi:hypothetical protein